MQLAHLRQRYSAQLAGFVVVAFTMIEMFVIPKSFFVLGSIVSTSSMACVAFLLLAGKPEAKLRFVPRNLAFGIVTALVLYGIFLVGNLAIRNYAPAGISTSSEQGIYSLFENTPSALLVVVLALDAIGFESYFRANLQSLFAGRLGLGSVFLVAIIDATIHLSTFNPLFPVTVIISDSVWGLNYYFTRDLSSNILSHFLWDLMIFVLFPIH